MLRQSLQLLLGRHANTEPVAVSLDDILATVLAGPAFAVALVGPFVFGPHLPGSSSLGFWGKTVLK